jgi:ferredoxin
MAKRISVVVSQGPSKNPVKRKLEEDIVAALLFENGIDVTVVPNLYDIKPDSTGMLALKSINGNLVVCSWLFERAAHWVLDRNEISGHVGKILLQNDDEEDDDDLQDQDEGNQDEGNQDNEFDPKSTVVSQREIPNRKIYCLDFKASSKADDFIDEVKRIRKENLVQIVSLGDVISSGSMQRFDTPTNDTAITKDGTGIESSEEQPSTVNRIENVEGRRWYPVIDYSRCTNCMECIDFCLFGVYGVDRIDTILVEQPDNCRKGCPACSRVCPENAIMFPQHKTPAIAGSADGNASMKIDLSQLFGAPADGKSAEEIAAMERDEQLLAAGRDAVGVSGRQRRQSAMPPNAAKDDLDELLDQLDDFE